MSDEDPETPVGGERSPLKNSDDEYVVSAKGEDLKDTEEKTQTKGEKDCSVSSRANDGKGRKSSRVVEKSSKETDSAKIVVRIIEKSNRGHVMEDSAAVEEKFRWAEAFMGEVEVPEGEMMERTKLLDIRTETYFEKKDKCKWLEFKLEGDYSCYLGVLMNQILYADSGMSEICSLKWDYLWWHDVDRKNAIMAPVARKTIEFPLNEVGPYFNMFDGDQMKEVYLLDASLNAGLYEVSFKML